MRGATSVFALRVIHWSQMTSAANVCRLIHISYCFVYTRFISSQPLMTLKLHQVKVCVISN